jgi:hypothetical protein
MWSAREAPERRAAETGGRLELTTEKRAAIELAGEHRP